MIDDEALRWALTVLFTLSAAECVYTIARHRGAWRGTVSHLLQLAMAVAMAVMAWPFSMTWPTLGPMVFFLVAAAWFGAAVVRPEPPAAHHCGSATHTREGRVIAASSVAMMGAMAWMYAVMNGGVLPGHGSVVAAPTAAGPVPVLLAHDHGHHGGDLPGMDMTHAAQPGYVAAVNWLLAIGFAAMAAVWLYRYFDRRHAVRGTGGVLPFVGDLCQVFMAAGMATMFAVMA
ncbi:MAG: DUF5134 domain-containing protein [Gordonia sp. (in: high G+C Gram-positive bacteria)]